MWKTYRRLTVKNIMRYIYIYTGRWKRAKWSYIAANDGGAGTGKKNKKRMVVCRSAVNAAIDDEFYSCVKTKRQITFSIQHGCRNDRQYWIRVYRFRELQTSLKFGSTPLPHPGKMWHSYWNMEIKNNFEMQFFQ